MSGAAPSRGLRLAVVGATGTVGSQLLELIEARRFPHAELKLFARSDSSAQGPPGIECAVSALHDPEELAAFDVAFLAIPEAAAAEILKAAPGPVLIDLSGAGRAASPAPPLAPGITTREMIAKLAAGRVLPIAHPAAHVLAAILSQVEPAAELVSATVIVGASSAGRETIAGLVEQSADLLNAKLEVDEDETQVAFNVFLHQRTSEMSRLIESQVSELLGRAQPLLLQVVQAPSLHGSALSIYLPVAGGGHRTREKLRASPGLLLIEEGERDFRGVVDTVGQEAVMVRLFEQPAGLVIWCMFDNARLSALSALWVAENLLAAGDSGLA
jgi:aspartate-semialdehyde dehydrogenase